MTEFQGAILLQQLARLPEQNAVRAHNAAYLAKSLSQIPGISPLPCPSYATRHSYHIFIFRFHEAEFGISRQDFLAALEKEGIPCSSGYAHPLYKNPMFVHQNFYPRGCPASCGHYDRTIDYNSFASLCPNVERACQEAVWLEQRELLGDEGDMDDISRAVGKIYECRHELLRAAVSSPLARRP
jgi:dTDP-4-amino-4,6-dideoxygalactose transaminase